MSKRTFFFGSAVALLALGGGVAAAAASGAGETEPANDPQAAVAVLIATVGNDVTGFVVLRERGGSVELSGAISGLTPGDHGFHVHEFGDLTAPDGESTGDHFAPHGNRHGGPDDAEHHAGDLGNVTADRSGVAVVEKTTGDFRIAEVIGRSIVVHEKADDLESQPSGDAGARLAVAVIGLTQEKGPMTSRLAGITPGAPDTRPSGRLQ